VHELSLGWRSRVRIAGGVLVTVVVGVLAATSGLLWPLRMLAGAVFLGGAYLCLDAIVFTSSWRFTASALKVPTLLSRRREISGRDDLTVELCAGWWSRLGVIGPNGRRTERINPLVSSRDLRRWWDAAP
jgi:hypothetical protein